MKTKICLENYYQAVMYFPLRKVCSGTQSKYSEGRQENLVRPEEVFLHFIV